MAYWSETRGLTLRLTHAAGAARFVRLTLVERRGLLGSWHNVREARAERAASEQGIPSALGEGRMLSWRPLPNAEADALLVSRTRTLERLGYCVIHSSESQREPWAWLQDLVHRQLRRSPRTPMPHPTHASAPGLAHTSAPGLDALSRVEFSEAIANVDASEASRAAAEPESSPDPDSDQRQVAEATSDQRKAASDEASTVAAMVNGFAELLGLNAEAFEHPDRHAMATVDLDALAPLLDQLVESSRPALRQVATRWLGLPALIYELDPAMVERWLEEGRAAARIIAPRLPGEGLALCGETSLRRLQQHSRSPRVRQFAAKWVSRLDP